MEHNINLSKIKYIVNKYKDENGSLIKILQKIQSEFGYIPESAVTIISDIIGLKESQIYGVVTFYAQFRLEPVGKYVIRVCHGTACHVGGANEITKAIEEELNIKNGQTTKDLVFTLESVACLGCCSIAPVMTINGKAYGNLTPDKAKIIIRKLGVENE